MEESVGKVRKRRGEAEGDNYRNYFIIIFS